ncbi:MAG TPA: FAD-dependent oxidoreductase, partial [Treponemataceae bacterium]|nr:FAD-dependent oxidoreductase [Treponemataceae bacterium]
MATYVIVGGVAGGAGTAARLRRLDEKAEIIMFERGEHISFANCGLPYYAGGVITDRSRLFVMTPEKFKEALNVEAKVRHEVVSINRNEKTVKVKNLATG